MFVIEKNIPVPTANRRPGGCKYPLKDMKISDSFFVPNCKSHSVSSTVSSYKRRYFPDRRFIVRTVIEDGVSGVRVWRISDNKIK